MPELVERLRFYECRCELVDLGKCEACLAADEIERLRAENKRFQTENGILRAIVGAYADQCGQGILKASVATLLAAATKEDDR